MEVNNILWEKDLDTSSTTAPSFDFETQMLNVEFECLPFKNL